jgi:acyl transferase domain-containing protein/acyl carrier protein
MGIRAKKIQDHFPDKKDIAIIGMSGRFPGSENLDIFWDNLKTGTDCIKEIPEERWNWKDFYDESQAGNRRVTPKWGGFITDMDKFDAGFFRISPKEAELMDPRQRILLETVWKAIEDAGYQSTKLAEAVTGLFIGFSGNDYYDLMVGETTTDAHTLTGNLQCFLANRISYILNLRGPSEVIDTACSSSLVAIHNAVHAIRANDCSIAIAGGVHALLMHKPFVSFGKAGMLSWDGRCKPFDESANGYVRGEGVGVIILKPLSSAEEDGDHIYGIIRSTAVNHGGKSNALTVPRITAQKDLLLKAYRDADIDITNVSYIETHGTGTEVGDPKEIEALKQAFAELTPKTAANAKKKHYCCLGTVKANIGHLEPAAGIAGVIKVLLAMKQQQLPALVHFKQLNKRITLTDSPFYVNKETISWPIRKNKAGKPIARIAGVSSFGLGGTNAHIVLEEYQPNPPIPYTGTKPALIVLSAKNEERLKDQVKILLDWIASNPGIHLHDLAYTLQSGRDQMEERLALTTNSITELEEQLSGFLAGKNACKRGNIKQGAEQLKLIKGLLGKILTTQLIEGGEYDQLLDLWCAGADIDWLLLYTNEIPRRMSLPTYPFAREAYWMPVAAIAADTNSSSMLHPLLHSNHSNLREQKFISCFTGKESFLLDHQVMGQKIMPGVAYIELALVAGNHSLEHKVTRIDDIAWLSPFRVEDKAQSICTGIYAQGNEVFYEIYSGEADEKQLHASGNLVTAAQRLPGMTDISMLKKQFLHTKNATECYTFFKEKGLNYGSSFQGIETIYYSETAALSKISLPAEPAFVLAPGILDSALQTCAGMSFNQEAPALSLPFSLQSAIIYHDLPATLWAYARKSSSNIPGSKVTIYDIDLLSEKGELLLSFKEFAALALDKGFERSTSKPLAEKNALQLFGNTWKETALVNGQSIAYTEQLILLAGGFSSLADQLKAGLATQVIALNAEREDAYFVEVLSFIKTIAVKSVVSITVICATDEYHKYGFISGCLKTAMLEFPNLFARLLIMDRLLFRHSDELQSIIAAEQGSVDIEIRYHNKCREVKTVEPLHHLHGGGVAIKPGGVYLITGGTGALGLLFARHISNIPGTKIILTGRTPDNDVIREKISGMSNCSYYAADITNLGSVHHLVKEITTRHGRIDGIIHSAGVIADSLIVNKTNEAILTVLSPKIEGLKNLDEAIANMPLDFFLLFSSLAGVTGNTGQSDYAAANAYLDNFAEWRNTEVQQGKRKGKSLSINWPLWSGGGMIMNDAAMQYLEQQWGILPLAATEGFRAFDLLLHTNLHQGIVTFGIAAKIIKKLSAGIKKTPVVVLAQNNKTDLHQLVSMQILELAARLLKIDVKNISADEEMGDYGFDSISLTQFANELNNYYEIDLMPTVFFNYPTADGLADFLIEFHADSLLKQHPDMTVSGEVLISADELELPEAKTTPAQPLSRQRFLTDVPHPAQSSMVNEPIAVVGISARFPGSSDLPSFWDNIKKDKDLVIEIPAERWDWRELYGDAQEQQGKTKAKWGGFIEDIDKFDPLFFNISPREAELMDPQQRITLQAVYHALEDAGIAPATIRGSDTGAFIGVSSSDYSMLLHKRADLSVQAQSSTGSAHSVLVNRISYWLDIHGPSEPVDTACSSSLIAIHRAVEHIRNGHCSMAIAGGVNAIFLPALTLSFSQAGMLSADGRCKTFDESANGYVRGEGVGVIILKPLSKAISDGDRIYGLIRGSGENHGGKANTLTSPNPNAQKDLLVKAYRQAGIDPRDVSFIEAHGTGTPLGDPVETEALKLAFRELSNGHQEPTSPYCGISSVKTNIGHLEAAAGIAGVIKVLLSLRHKILPGNPHLQTPNKYLKLEGSPFYLQQKASPWTTSSNKSRIAGVSSFGFGGSNAHIILEEYIPPVLAPFTSSQPAVIVLSAKDEIRLQHKVKDLIAYMDMHQDADLYDIAYTLQTGREAMEERLAIVAADKDALLTALLNYPAMVSEHVFTGNSFKSSPAFSPAQQDIPEHISTENDLFQLAGLWVRGVSVDWHLLYRGARPQKISLPGYPFAKERCWIPAIEAGTTTAESSVALLHPLVHRNESNLYEQKFISTYSGKENFLSDHRIGTDKVLPGVAYIELARAAGDFSSISPVKRLTDITWLSPLRVNGTAQSVGISLVARGEDMAYEIYSLSTDGTEQVYSRGMLSVAAAHQRVAPYPIASIRERLAASKDGPSCYAIFKEQGLDYGLSFQGIRMLHFSAEEALSEISLPPQPGYLLSPGIMDSAFQTCIGLSFGAAAIQPVLPFSVASVTIYEALPDRVWSYVRKNKGQKSGSSVLRFDIDLLNEAGVVLVQFEDLCVIPAAPAKSVMVPQPSTIVAAAAKEPLKEEEPVNKLLYVPVWKRRKLPDTISSGGKHLLIGGSSKPGVLKTLKDQLSAKGAVVELHKTLKTIPEDITDIYFLQGLSLPTGKDTLLKGYGKRELAVFNAIQLLLSSSYQQQSLNITVFTFNTQEVLSSDHVSFSGSGLPGLLGSLSKEQPGWRIRVIDLSSLSLSAPAGEQVLAVPYQKDITIGAFRNGHYYQPALFPAELPAVTSSRFRMGGTYVLLGGAGGIGRVTSAYLVKNYKANIIWLGRRAADGDIVRGLEEIEALGVRPRYIQCDATIRVEVEAAYAAITAGGTSINGVFHAAIVLNDMLLKNMDEAAFNRSFLPKSSGSHHLAEIFSQASPDFFCFYSSIQSQWNGAGQANYAAGCTYKDSYARYVESSMGIPVHIINWGYWGDVGVVSSEAYRQRIAMMGIGSIDAAAGMKIVETVLANQQKQIIAVKLI